MTTDPGLEVVVAALGLLCAGLWGLVIPLLFVYAAPDIAAVLA